MYGGSSPNAFAGSDQIVTTDTQVQLTGSGSSDADNDALTYQWVQTGGTAVTLSDNAIANPTFTTPSTTGLLTFSLTVTDEHGLTDTDNVTVNVGIVLDIGDGNTNNTDGGSGCTVSENGRFDPLWLMLLLFLAGIHLRNRQRINRG